MDYLDFFNKLKTVDSRIEFSLVERKLDSLEAIPNFYNIINPQNVEFEFNDGIIRLASYEELALLKKYYPYISDVCIFATCNGEPVYIKNSMVYTCVYGGGRIIEEKLAESIESLFINVSNSLE